MVEYCKSCIIPNNFPNISFKNKKCQFCNVKKHTPKKRLLNKKNLLKQLNNKSNSKYDCLVPLSGGKDSSFILYYIVKKLKKKPLACFLKSNFTTPQAKKNVKNLCKELNVDLIIEKTSPFRKKIVKEGLNFYKASNQIYMKKICRNCENHLRFFSMKIADQYNIDKIIYGSSDFEDPPSSFISKKSKKYRQKFGKEKITLSKIYLEEFKPVIKAKKFIKAFRAFIFSYFYSVLDNLYLKIPIKDALNPFLEIKFDDKRVIYFFDYVNYNPFKQIKILKKNTSWRGLKDKDIRMDCYLHSFANLKYLKEMNISCLGFYYSNLVRNNLLSRKKAFLLEKNEQKNVMKNCSRIARKLKMDLF